MNPDVFCQRGPGYAIFFSATKVEFVTAGGRVLRNALPRKLTMRLAGANRQSSAFPSDELPGKSNYLIGRDPSRWRRDVVQYTRLRYEKIYPGIDVVYRGDGLQLEYDFEVLPRASTNRIRLEFFGADLVSVDDSGRLVVSSGGRRLLLQPPKAYQQREGRQVEIPVHYVLLGHNQAGFRVGQYDHGKALVIDPVVGFSTYFTGGVGQWIFAMALDETGNIYAAGTTVSADLATLNPIQQQMHGIDGFLVKLDPTASTVLYATFLGGSGLDEVRGIAVDGQHNIYLAGDTDSPDFPLANAAQATFVATCPLNPPGAAYQPPCRDAFMAKLDSTGSRLLYSSYLGGGTDDAANAIAVDSLGNAHIAGFTLSSDFPVTAGGSSSGDVFVAKVDSTGKLVFSTRLGGSAHAYVDADGFPSAADAAEAIALDSAGNIYATGYAASDDFPLLHPMQSLKVPYPSRSAFVAKWSAAGVLSYSTFLGSTSRNLDAAYAQSHFARGRGIGLDSAENIYVLGETNFESFPTRNAFQPTLASSIANDAITDIFLTKLSPDGSQLLYSTFFGGGSIETASGLAVNAAGNVAMTGVTQSTDFPVKDAIQTASKMVLIKSNDQGTTWQGSNRGLASTDVNGILFDASAPSRIFALSSYSGLFVSNDSGASWTNTVGTNALIASTSDGASPATLYASISGSGVWRITGGGTSFTSAAGRGLPNGNVVLSLAYSQAARLYAIVQWPVPVSGGQAYGYGVFVSANGGDDWTQLLDVPALPLGVNLNTIAVDPRSTTTIYVLGSSPAATPGYTVTNFYKSTDGGSIWTSAQLDNQSVAPMTMLVVDPRNSSVLYAAGQAGYFKSTDGGGTWAWGSKRSSTDWVTVFAVSPTNSSVLYISSTQPVPGLYKSTDGGATWGLTSIVNRLPSSLAFDPANPATMYVGLGIAVVPSSVDTGEGDAFVSLFDPVGQLVFSTYLGGSGLDVGQAVGFTLVGNLVVAGYSTSGDFPTTSGSYQPVYTAGLTPQPFTNSPCVQIAASCPPGDFYRFPASGFITGYEKLELRAETTAVTLKAGESRALTLSVFPRIGDKTTSVQLSCSGLPNGSSCEFSPSQLMPGTEPTPVSLTIRTTSTATARVVAPHGPGLAWLLALTVAPGFLVSCWRRRLTRRPRAGMLLVVMMSLALLNLGCGSSETATTAQQSGAGTIAGTYQVTVRAVWGTTESSTGITLTVQ